MNFTKKELDERFESLLISKQILDDLNIKYFLEGGALLGIIRDSKFIDWDNDIELAVFAEDVFGKEYLISNEFIKNGFDITYVDNTYENFKINAYIYKHTKVCILSYYLKGKYRRRELLQYLAIFFDNYSEINFNNESFRSVNKDYLEWTYKNWKVPERTNKQKNYFRKHVFANRDYLLLIKKKFKFYISLIIHGSLSFYSRLVSSREKNFLYIINKIKFNCKTMIEIGSSDGIESISFLKNNRGKSVYIFEPQIKIYHKLKSKFIKNQNVKIFNMAITDTNKTINFYENNKKNLSSIIFKNKSKLIKIDSSTIDSFFSKNDIEDPIIIKFDIEGAEYELLKGALKTLLSKKIFYLVFELHPTEYSKESRNIKSIIKTLFNNGFNTLFVESALLPIPNIFKEENLKPFLVRNNRGLYNNISNEFILQNAFDKKYEFRYPSWTNCKYMVSNKSIRSICLTNNKLLT